ncbi:glycosyltransferase family 4 protein [Patescibacteria group bacterium]|nr:glycosyltransferase family 4 protein [Patescibacteria group bacterium]
MRIAIDIRGLARDKQGGVGEYTKQLLRAIFSVSPEHDYVLLSTGTEMARRHVLDNLEQIGADEHRAHVRHVHINEPNKKLNFSIFTRETPYLDELAKVGTDRCDVFFFPNLNFITTNSTPSVVTMHDLSWRIFPQFFTAKDRAWHQAVRPGKTLNEAEAVIVPSLSTKRDLVSLLKIDETKIHVIPHGIDHHIFQPKTLAQDHGVRSQHKLPKQYILYLGTIEPRKNIHALLDAFENSKLITKNYQLVLAGGPGWKSADILERIKNTAHVQYLGYVPAEHRPALYRGASAFIFPSIYEGFGLPVLEAMACGTPVITSHTSSLPEITQNAAMLINPYNANDIAEALSQLLASSELQTELTEQGLARAAEFDWTKTAKSTLKVLQSTALYN